jgi:hypothetical protein
MRWLLLAVLVGGWGCSPEYPEHFGRTTLPGVVEVGVGYRFDIQLPPKAVQAGFEWRHEDVLIFKSIVIKPKTETITTEMFFRYPGKYTLILYVVDPRGQIHTFKSIYLGVEPVDIYGRHMPNQ